MVENLGRANFGAPHNFEQLKGLWEGEVVLDGEITGCVIVLQKVASELHPKVRNHGEGPY